MTEVVVLDSTRDFAALEEEWENLHRSAPLATPFQSWAWLYTWWESYGKDYELRLVAVRHGGLLVGLVPLMLERQGGLQRRLLRRLLFVGNGLSDYQDVLAREGWETEVCNAGVQAIGQMDGWRVADLQQLRPEAVTWGFFEAWAGSRTRLWQDNLPVIDVKPWDELLRGVSGNLRSTARRTIHRVEADEVRGELVGMDEAERAARRWVALHRETWRKRDISAEHLTRRFESLLQTAVRRMTARGLGGIYEFRRDGEVVVSHFLVFGRDFVGEHLFGATQQALRRYQVSTLLIWDMVNVARSRNSTYLNLLRGEEPYKLRWNPKMMPNYRAILGRSLVLWAPYAGYHALHSRVRRYEGLEEAPWWAKSIAAMYRIVQRVRR